MLSGAKSKCQVVDFVDSFMYVPSTRPMVSIESNTTSQDPLMSHHRIRIDASVSVVESGVETGDKGTGAGVDGRGRVPLPKTVSTYVRDSASIIYS